MKLLKYIMFGFLGTVLMMSCDDQPELGFDESIPGINLRMVPSLPSFNLLDADPEIEFTFYTESNRIAEVNLLVEYQPVGGTLTDRIVFTTLLPSDLSNDGSSKVTAKLLDLAADFNVDQTNLAGGDLFTFYNVVTTTDGLTYPDTVKLDGNPFLNIENALITATATTSFTSNMAFPISCPSELAGVEVDYEVLDGTDSYSAPIPLITGTMDWQVGSAPFNFTWETYSFGTYGNAYGCCEQNRGNSTLEVSDICGTLSISPTDGYGCTWFLDIESITGAEMILELTGGPGGCFGNVRVKMTRTDGSDWPALTS